MTTINVRCLQNNECVTKMNSPDEVGQVRHLVTIAVRNGCEQNKKLWGGEEPNGQMQLGQLPPEIASRFKAGKKYTLTIKELAD